jgi:hypothetical protein
MPRQGSKIKSNTDGWLPWSRTKKVKKNTKTISNKNRKTPYNEILQKMKEKAKYIRDQEEYERTHTVDNRPIIEEDGFGGGYSKINKKKNKNTKKNKKYKKIRSKKSKSKKGGKCKRRLTKRR